MAGARVRAGRPIEAEDCTVLQVLTRMNIGGPARQVLLLHRLLSEQVPMAVAAGRPPSHEGALEVPGAPVHPLPLRRPVRPATDLAALVAMQRLITSLRPRIVHTHMAKAGAVGRLGARAARCRPRTVHTFHGHVLGGYFRSAPQRAFLAAERALARRTDVLVAVSAEIRDELLDLGVGRRGQYEVIPLGIDLEPYLRVGGHRGALRGALGLADDVPLVGVLGRLVPIKDHATLLGAMARVPGAHLAVLGDGELRGSLEALAGDRALAGRVHFTGWWADVPGALADLDVVALASRNEGTPVALIEALAAARPVVATDVGGVRAVVEEQVTGRLCPAGDERALAGVLSEVLDEREAARDRACRGRSRMVERFGAGRMAADHRALYEQLLRHETRT